MPTGEHKALLGHAKDILSVADAARSRAMKDKRSTAEYWNADDWGSIQGVRDAHEWVAGQIQDAIAIHLHKIGVKP